MSLFEISYVVLWLLVVVLAVGLYALYYHFGEMYMTSPEGRATHGPTIGEPLRESHGTPLEGATWQLPRVAHRTVLLFTAPDCAVCRGLLSELEAEDDRDGTLADLIVVASGSIDEAEKWRGIVSPQRIVVDPRGALRSRYGVGLTPFGVAADAAGVVRTRGVVSSARDLRGLILQARIDDGESMPIATPAVPQFVDVRG